MKIVTFLTVTALTLLIALKAIGAITLTWAATLTPLWFILGVALLWVAFRRQFERIVREGR